MTDKAGFGRVLRTGLSWLRHQAANLRCRLAAMRFNPSRKGATYQFDNAKWLYINEPGSW